MLRILTMIILGLQAWTLHADDGSNPAEKTKVIERLQKFTSDINAGKTDLASYWTEDGELINPVTGEVIDGDKNIEQYLQNKVRELNGKKINFEVGDVSFPQDDTAVVKGVLKIYDNNNLVDQRARRIELVKDDQDGNWYLYTISEIVVDPAPSTYEHLKALEWMLGTWKDEDDNVTIQFFTKWDKYKNFLIQKFTMQVYGLEAMEGVQIIGWDPVEHKIRSWVYDSDGGFGSGDWTEKDSGWSAAMTYTLEEGKRATSTNIYKKIDDKSYSYSSVDRKIEGESIPDVAAVTVVKEAS